MVASVPEARASGRAEDCHRHVPLDDRDCVVDTKEQVLLVSKSSYSRTGVMRDERYEMASDHAG